MTVAFIIYAVLCFLDESGILLFFALVFALVFTLLFGASYVIGLGWHAAT